MGVGWGVEPESSAVYRGGSQPGFTSMLYHMPARHVTIAIMMNHEGVGDEITELARRLARAARMANEIPVVVPA